MWQILVLSELCRLYFKQLHHLNDILSQERYRTYPTLDTNYNKSSALNTLRTASL